MKHLKEEPVATKIPHSHGAHAQDLRQQMVPALGMLVPSYADTPLIKFNLHRRHHNELITVVSSKSGSQRSGAHLPFQHSEAEAGELGIPGQHGLQ